MARLAGVASGRPAGWRSALRCWPSRLARSPQTRQPHRKHRPPRHNPRTATKRACAKRGAEHRDNRDHQRADAQRLDDHPRRQTDLPHGRRPLYPCRSIGRSALALAGRGYSGKSRFAVELKARHLEGFGSQYLELPPFSTSRQEGGFRKLGAVPVGIDCRYRVAWR